MDNQQELFDELFWNNVRGFHNSKKASDFDQKMPRVGPFWFVEKIHGVFEFIDKTVGVTRSDKFGDGPNASRGVKKAHSMLWEEVQQEHPELKGKLFFDVPRGRIYFKRYDKYIVMLSELALADDSLKKAIKDKFNLPEDSTQFIHNAEYDQMD